MASENVDLVVLMAQLEYMKKRVVNGDLDCEAMVSSLDEIIAMIATDLED